MIRSLQALACLAGVRSQRRVRWIHSKNVFGNPPSAGFTCSIPLQHEHFLRSNLLRSNLLRTTKTLHASDLNLQQYPRALKPPGFTSQRLPSRAPNSGHFPVDSFTQARSSSLLLPCLLVTSLL
ncbi:hypothetical protein KC19_7G039500 [Ceratodon purpureus]|uniref:Uncharacterized protein n=1 Tax=Ceratodon purpureus TaxID=3225 RepID=A0A8T0H6V3_CERPU|nr:hypothetical protein KC19_7G039500 [Ceratodon purpureus]